MTTLSEKQRHFLKQLAKHPLSSANNLDDEDLHICRYLYEANYIHVETSKNLADLSNGLLGVSTLISGIYISEKGKAYLYEHRMTSLCFVIPTIISLAALAVSIFALFCK